MQGIVSSLMSIVLPLHAAFGCCWRHVDCLEHACVSPSQPAKPCCQHDWDGTESKPTKPCGCQVECQGTCTYVAPEKVRIAGQPLVASFHLPAILPEWLAAHTVTALSWQFGHSPLAAAPPLRLHLLHQSLLN
jgi:hypothetical protein